MMAATKKLPAAARRAGAQERDVGRRAMQRSRAVLENFETYRMLTNLLTMVAHGPDPGPR